jgi:hypothetical protein
MQTIKVICQKNCDEHKAKYFIVLLNLTTTMNIVDAD